MNLEQALVVSSEQACENTRLLWLSAPAVGRAARPGQFLMIRCGEGCDPLLPRPMSFHRFRQVGDERQFAILFDRRGRGTDWLWRRQPGDLVSLFGPLGRGYSVRRESQNLLLVAGGIGISALVSLADEAIAGGRAVTLLQGAKTAARLFPSSSLPPEVEVASATDDGSAGHRGLVTELLPQYLPWADQVFACGPNAMYEAMAAVMRQQTSRKPVQVLLEEHMACGMGVCYCCAVFTRRGVRLVCKDGPRFELREVFP
ncbi:MAG: dihydroorotate dehydrogenase electron transfer subunit [Dehalococcoidia bacterium]|nr:dihydroorotate dehydrogenase electron transfer subunit [Dehalococcoidia bacterium]